MKSGFRIGRIWGIDLIIDWSWFLILVLISWNLSAVFGNYHPDWGMLLRWGVAITATILFFTSVLAHELAHSLMARFQGIPVRKIVLYLFGGVSNIQREPDSPYSEFLITLVGPLTSIGIGFLIFILAGFWIPDFPTEMTAPEQIVSSMGPLTTLLFWLAPANIVVGLFNLIPGFPLDGGRILRSVLWLITNNLRKATRWAAGVGQTVAWLMIIAGVMMIFGFNIPFFGTGLSGVWLAFIGWFLSGAAIQSYRQVVVREVLEDVPVSHVMRVDPPTVSPDTSIDELVNDHVLGTDDHSFPVVANGNLLGIVTLEDIREVPKNRRETTRVRDIMTPSDELETVAPRDDVAEALNELRQLDVRQLPVVRNQELLGLLRRRDILRWLQLQTDVS